MKHKTTSQLSLTITLALAALAVPAQALTTTFTSSGDASADILPTLNSFRSAIGGANNGANNTLGTIHTTGRREITWDGGAPVNLPGNFFNANSRRGAVFTTPGLGFLLSQNVGSGGNERFGDIDATYSTTFTFNSANRLFVADGSTITDTTFRLPNDPTVPAAVNAFGAVFTDVDILGSAGIQFFDAANNLIGEALAPVNDGGLSFVGLVLDPGVLAARVRLISGNTPLGAGIVDGATLRGSTVDLVAMDDFIYSEPLAFTPVPEVGTVAGASALGGAVLLGALRKRQAGRENKAA
jgi:hypothetical protein